MVEIPLVLFLFIIATLIISGFYVIFLNLHFEKELNYYKNLLKIPVFCETCGDLIE